MEDDFGHLVERLMDREEEVVPTLKSVLEAGLTDRFSRTLDTFSKTKENELKQLCNVYYADFSESVQRMISLKESAEDLKAQLLTLDMRLQSQGNSVLHTAKSLEEAHLVRNRLDAGLTAVTRATNLVRLAQRAREQIKSCSYFSALKTLKLLSGVLVAQEKKCALLRSVERWIPHAVEEIKVSARERLTKWFVEVRQGGSRLGQNVMDLAMKNLAEQQRIMVSMRLKSTSSKRLRARMKGQQLHRLRSKSSSEVLKMDLNSGRPDTQLDSLLTRFVDYTPVYQFLHIFDCLDVKRQAIEIYKANRLPQIKLESMGGADANRRFATPFHKVLQKVLGFYLIEERLSSSLSSEIFSRQDLDRMWNQTLDDLQAMVDADMSSRPANLISTVKLVLALSLLLGHVRSGIAAMDDTRPVSPGLPSTNAAAGLAQELSSHPAFGNVVNCSRLLQMCKDRSRAIQDAVLATFASRANGVLIEEETCQPYGRVDQGSKEWDIAYLRGLKEVVVDNEYYPQGDSDVTMTCSTTVFQLCMLLDELVDLAILLNAHLGVRFVDIDGGEGASLPARVLGLLFKEINGIMSSTIANNDVSLELLCQYYVNWIYMAHVADSFQQQWSPSPPPPPPPSSSSPSQTNGSHHVNRGQVWAKRFEETGEVQFGKLLEIIPQKILALLSSSVSIDWTPTNRAERPHEFMLDLLQYLKIAFGPDSATRLLPTVKYQTVLFKSCTTISTGLLDIICDAGIGQVNAVAFQHLLLDVEAVVGFARENPVEGLEECFIQLHQTVSLFINGEIEVYLDLNERAMKYPNVKATNVLLILRKYKPLGVASRLFSRAQAQSFTSIDAKLVQHAMRHLAQELGEI